MSKMNKTTSHWASSSPKSLFIFCLFECSKTDSPNSMNSRECNALMRFDHYLSFCPDCDKNECIKHEIREMFGDDT